MPLTLTPNQAARVIINATNFDFPLYKIEIRLNALRAKTLKANIESKGFVVIEDSERNGYIVKTQRGTLPAFVEEDGHLPMIEAIRMFS